MVSCILTEYFVIAYKLCSYDIISLQFFYGLVIGGWILEFFYYFVNVK